MKYKGNELGKINLCSGGYELAMNSLDALITLLTLKPGDIIEANGRDVPYSEIQEKILPNVRVIYTSKEARLKDMFPLSVEDYDM